MFVCSVVLDFECRTVLYKKNAYYLFTRERWQPCCMAATFVGSTCARVFVNNFLLPLCYINCCVLFVAAAEWNAHLFDCSVLSVVLYQHRECWCVVSSAMSTHHQLFETEGSTVICVLPLVTCYRIYETTYVLFPEVTRRPRVGLTLCALCCPKKSTSRVTLYCATVVCSILIFIECCVMNDVVTA